MKYIIVDFETRSECDLIAQGLKNYAHDPSTDILMLGYKVEGEDEVHLWEPGAALPEWMSELDQYHLYAFNAEFEMALWNEVAVKKHNFPTLELKNITCLAALANRYGLPNSMGDVAQVLECAHTKNPEGTFLIQYFCTPKYGWQPDPEKYARFKKYCLDDVLAEEDILLNLPSKKLSETEREIWEHTVHMNTIGIPVDVESVKRIRLISEQYRESLYELLPELTDGLITKITQAQRIKNFCASRGYVLPDLTAFSVEQALASDIQDDDVMQVLEMRAQIGLSSVGKYVRMQNMNYNGRIYYNQRYYGAHTGRYTGSGVQLLNLPRASVNDPEAEIEAYFTGDIVERNPVKSARALIRSMIRAPEGKLICAADYSSIEYVVLEWFAGNQEALDRFAAGFCAYKDQAAFMFNTPYEEISKEQRQGGKVAVLGCGYQAGAMAIMNFALTQFGLELTEGQSMHIVRGYRSKHHHVAAMWNNVTKATIEAVANPGKEVVSHMCSFKVVKDHRGMRWLTITLPSGRRLFYAKPFLEVGKFGPVVCHHGFSQTIKRWCIMQLIPGRITENIVQATARDLLSHGMKQCREAGLEIIWTCYDEVILEIGDDNPERDLALLCEKMCTKEEWAKGIPVKAEGFFGKRYKKM